MYFESLHQSGDLASCPNNNFVFLHCDFSVGAMLQVTVYSNLSINQIRCPSELA